jgi:hypothetical protein
VPGTDANCIQYYDPSSYIDLGDLGHNVDYPDSACPGVNGNPLLGSLANSGGPTFTMLPSPGSSAIGGVPSPCPVNVDQRGLPRPGGGSGFPCDIGAVETGSASPPVELSVAKSGTGSGTVTSSPAGINCGGTCASNFAVGQQVTLTASPASDSSFSGWSGGGCAGTGTCQVTLSVATSVTATFAANSTPPPDGGGGGGGAATPPPGPTGKRAAALKKCKKKKGQARANCIKKAKKLPV